MIVNCESVNTFSSRQKGYARNSNGFRAAKLWAAWNFTPRIGGKKVEKRAVMWLCRSRAPSNKSRIDRRSSVTLESSGSSLSSLGSLYLAIDLDVYKYSSHPTL